MKISQKVARMAMGYEGGKKKAEGRIECKGNTHRGGCEHLPKETHEESKENILNQYSNYIANLAVFHTDAMELLRYMDYHWVGTDNRFDTKAKIKDLIKQGKEIKF